MIVISRCAIENGERHVTREVTLSARKSIPSKNNFRGITLTRDHIRAISCETTHLEWVGRNLSTPYNLFINFLKIDL